MQNFKSILGVIVGRFMGMMMLKFVLILDDEEDIFWV